MSPHISRREFLAIAAKIGGAAAVSPLLAGCSTESPDRPTPKPTSKFPLEPAATSKSGQVSTMTEPSIIQPPVQATLPSKKTAQVALVKAESRTEGVRRVIDLFGPPPVRGKSVFLKPNFNSSDPTPGSTHLDVVAELVTSFQQHGASRITIGDRSGMGNTRQVMQEIGIFDLAQAMVFDVTVFDELPAQDWVEFQPVNSHWQRGFWMARPCLDADVLVQTCCLKTHRFGGHFTLSLKNSVGMVAKRIPQANYNYMTELHNSIDQRRMIAEINAAYSPSLVVMDGFDALISGGPDSGDLVHPKVFLAGTDRVAIDAVGVAMLRYFGCKTEAAAGKIFEQEQIARAVELGLGVDSPERIEFLTDDPSSLELSRNIQDVLLEG